MWWCRRTCVAAALVVAVLSGASAQADRPAAARKTTVDAALATHPALKHIDVQFCGTGSEAQISRGPLGCGFPIAGDHPWLVALGYKSQLDGALTFACSGALITARHVVTSALCARGTATMRLASVRAGEYNLTSARDCLWYEPSECLSVQEVPVARVRTHPGYDQAAYVQGAPSYFDLAVVELEHNVTVQFGVNPICLPMFPLRRPPKALFATSFSLVTPAPAKPAPAAADDVCCSCDRNRSATYSVMDQEKLVDYNATYNGSAPCQYRLLAAPEAEGGPPAAADRCLGAGHPCVADLGAPLVGVDRFGSAYYLLGVASTVPAVDVCRHTPGASVLYLPVQPHVRWILDQIDCLENDNCDAR